MDDSDSDDMFTKKKSPMLDSDSDSSDAFNLNRNAA